MPYTRTTWEDFIPPYINAAGLNNIEAAIVDIYTQLGLGVTDPAPPPGAPDTSGPTGPPGSWILAFSDDFSGTSIDTSKWTLPNSGTMNNVTMTASLVSVSGGQLILQLSSDGVGGGLVTSSQFSGATHYELPVGGYAEASVYFPGDAGDHIWNFPAWWTTGESWPANGEIDIAEGLSGELTANYHNNSGAFNSGPIAGTWNNAFHTYGAHRKSGSIDWYWDGVLVRTLAQSDSGGGQALVFNAGKSNSRTLHPGLSGAVKVEWVKAWHPQGTVTTGGSIAPVGSGLVTQIASGAGSFAVNMPTGITAGQFLVVHLATSLGTAPTAPAGWTLIPSSQQLESSAPVSGQGYYRVATGSETSTYTWTGCGTGRCTGIVQRFSGVDGTTPLDAVATSAQTPVASSLTIPQVVSASQNAMLISGASLNAATAAALVKPFGMTESGQSTGTGRRASLAYQVQANPAGSGPRIWADTPATSLQYAGWLAALRPA